MFSNGTNPEIVLVIEARKQGTKKPTWNAGFLQLSAAAIQAWIDDETVFTAVRQRMNDQKPYMFSSTINSQLNTTNKDAE